MGFLDGKIVAEEDESLRKEEAHESAIAEAEARAYRLVQQMISKLPGVHMEMWKVAKRFRGAGGYLVVIDDIALAAFDTRLVPNPKLTQETRLEKFFGTNRSVPKSVEVEGGYVAVLCLQSNGESSAVLPWQEVLYIEDLQHESLQALVESVPLPSKSIQAGRDYVLKYGVKCWDTDQVEPL